MHDGVITGKFGGIGGMDSGKTVTSPEERNCGSRTLGGMDSGKTVASPEERNCGSRTLDGMDSGKTVASPEERNCGSRTLDDMDIRRAVETDLEGINRLLRQVLMVHHEGRPDLFKADAKKYTDAELVQMIRDEKRPIFVAADENNEILGYAFCILEQYVEHAILTDIKTLYIDDLCVEEEKRGSHIGSRLYEYVLEFAREQGCYNVTLNVWSCNTAAMQFYEKCGLKPQKTGMEVIL